MRDHATADSLVTPARKLTATQFRKALRVRSLVDTY